MSMKMKMLNLAWMRIFLTVGAGKLLSSCEISTLKSLIADRVSVIKT